ncbi:MAG: glutathione S-transferase N-terminal domain-containing protein [Candidatus Marinimicrobia bacterium]|nr:glutathione S-transferase N-terminal domain-containing protein [Candidatus Neomarinimicrobiota bacterium]
MIKMYTTNWCPWCQRAKRVLEEKGLKFDVINIEELEMSRDELEKITGGRSVPQIVINDKPIGGFDNLFALNQSGKLDELVQSQ